MPYLYLALIVVIGLFVLTVMFSGHDLGYLLNFKRHEWYREMRRDYFTSRLQFWREWRGLKRFARTNAPWLYGLGVGIFGLCLAMGLLLGDLPKPVSAAELAYNDGLDITRFPTHVSSIQSVAANEVVVVPKTRNLLVQLPMDLPGIAASKPVGEEPTQPLLDPADLGQFTPEPPDQELELEETPVITRVPARTRPTEDEIQAAFEEFDPKPTPDITPEPAPEFDAIVLRETLPEYSDITVVDSTPDIDINAALARLESDDWVRGDKIRLEEATRPQLYLERYGLPRASVEDLGPIVVRPLTAPGQADPGVTVRKTILRNAIAGAELAYEIIVTNPTGDRVSNIVVEESLPATWDFVNAEPRGKLIRRDTLQWRLEPLEPDAAVSLRIRVLAGEEAEATTRTVISTAAAVQATVTVTADPIDALQPLPDLNFNPPATEEPKPAPPSLPDPKKWRPAERTIPTPELTEVDRVPLAPELRLSAKVASRVSLGHFRIMITVTNTGERTVDDARVKLWLSNLVKHPGGTEIEQAVGRLLPAQSRTLPVHLKAITPGDVINKIELRSATGLYDSTETKFVITRPPVSPENQSNWRRR